ncbi:MAG: hypothetical protein K8I82_04560 [Anaerolineae bacterium]|nr:hypothetical protein [Anaerolineae bacterium]
MSPVIDLDMLNEVAAFASYLRFDVSKMHVRYAPEGWREDKTKLIEHPHALSAAMDMLLIASMLETMVSHLGGQRPIPPRNEMVIYRNYDFYQQLAKRIYDQSKPAITTASASPQAATSEWVQTATVPGTVDWAALLTPIVEQVGKMVLSMLQQWLAGKIQTR